MLAAERGAARNTILAYGRDLEQAEELIGSNLDTASSAHRFGDDAVNHAETF